jgi:hypothetical protein
MATPPSKLITLSYADMQREFDANGWAERLKKCEERGRSYIESTPGRGSTIQKTYRKYWDANGATVAVTIEYKRVDGIRFCIRYLRHKDIAYSGPLPIGSSTPTG